MNESRNRLNGTYNCTRFGLDSRKGEEPLSYGSDGDFPRYVFGFYCTSFLPF
ncbi:hypothetical protein Hdeb2414_s0018g00524421 [Helianthus debilis subsp. tardiflorus]